MEIVNSNLGEMVEEITNYKNNNQNEHIVTFEFAQNSAVKANNPFQFIVLETVRMGRLSSDNTTLKLLIDDISLTTEFSYKNNHST